MLLYEISAAWVTGVSDVVSFAQVPVVFTWGFCVCQTPLVLDQNWFVKLKAGTCRMKKYCLGFQLWV